MLFINRPMEWKGPTQLQSMFWPCWIVSHRIFPRDLLGQMGTSPREGISPFLLTSVSLGQKGVLGNLSHQPTACLPHSRAGALLSPPKAALPGCLGCEAPLMFSLLFCRCLLSRGQADQPEADSGCCPPEM